MGGFFMIKMKLKEQIKKGKEIAEEQKEPELPKEPFRAYSLKEEREPDKYGRPISIRLNAEERAWLNEIKEDLDLKNDSRALKIAAFCGKNVLQTMFSRKILRYLFKKDRQKKEDL